jgi:hypothetical protein
MALCSAGKTVHLLDLAAEDAEAARRQFPPVSSGVVEATRFVSAPLISDLAAGLPWQQSCCAMCRPNTGRPARRRLSEPSGALLPVPQRAQQQS